MMLNQAGVYYQELDLSQVITASGTLPAAIVVAASKGVPFQRTLITSPKEYIRVFGEPNPSLGYGGYCALAYLQQGNQLYVVRVTGAGSTYGTLVLQKKAADTQIVLTNYTYSDTALSFSKETPTWDFTTVVAGSATNENHVIFFPFGQGDLSNIGLEIVSRNLLAVTSASVTATPAVGSGSLAVGTYSYVISAYNAYGETVATPIKTATTTAANSRVTLSWTAVPGASGYRVYGRSGAPGSFPLLAVVSTNTYTDNGSDTPDANFVQQAASTIVTSQQFTVNVYDKTTSSSVPSETFDVTLRDTLDGFGRQMRIDDVINPQSGLIRCVLNTAPATAPTPASINVTYCPAGTVGSAVSDTDVIRGWGLFEDVEQVYVRILINGGYATAAVQTEMLRIANKRQDCMAFLDVPSTSQEATRAVQYRNATLNANTNRGALFAQDLLIADPYTGRQMYVPPSGHMAALALRSAYMSEAWYPMAGLNRGILNVLGVRYQYDEGQRELLKNAQINYCRNFRGQGIALFEQVTLQSKRSGYSFIHVRQLIDEVQIAIRRFLLYAVHELNDDFLRRQIVNAVTAFLQEIVNRRGIRRFLVVADERNNTAQNYMEGVLNLDVYIDPMLSADRIGFKSILTRADQVFEELLAA